MPFPVVLVLGSLSWSTKKFHHNARYSVSLIMALRHSVSATACGFQRDFVAFA